MKQALSRTDVHFQKGYINRLHPVGYSLAFLPPTIPNSPQHHHDRRNMSMLTHSISTSYRNPSLCQDNEFHKPPVILLPKRRNNLNSPLHNRPNPVRQTPRTSLDLERLKPDLHNRLIDPDLQPRHRNTRPVEAVELHSLRFLDRDGVRRSAGSVGQFRHLDRRDGVFAELGLEEHAETGEAFLRGDVGVEVPFRLLFVVLGVGGGMGVRFGRTCMVDVSDVLDSIRGVAGGKAGKAYVSRQQGCFRR